MRIRAITIGEKIPYLTDNSSFEMNLEKNLQKFALFNNDLIEQLKKSDLNVQTKRLSSQPILSYDQQLYEKNLNENLVKIHDQLSIAERIISKYGIDYFASCALLADEQILKYGVYEKLLLNEVPEFIKRRDNFFSSIQVASSENGINLSALSSGAKIIKELSDPDPFKNLNFCISSNVSPDTPFFPAAYHTSENPSFSLALEIADEVVKVFETSKNINDAQVKLRAHFEEIYDTLIKICDPLATKHKIKFHGIDFSPAPYPSVERSIGTAFEKLNYEYFGAYGSLLAVALITNAIPKKDKIIGFSGFMPSVLEDFTIARSLIENNFSLDTLLLYATLCGTGLDCIPLPGDITEKELFYILLDICTISLRLKKPLTARLMPIPGKEAGDDVKFDFEYFAPSKIMDIRRLKGIKSNDIYSQKIKDFNFIK
jgi:uncharacterized protein (UPF0210 family)